jgi:hypothetical protein
MTAPQWLTRHGGSLKLGSDQRTWYVLVDGKPNYSVTHVPQNGRFGCKVRQTNNGEMLNVCGSFASPNEAIGGGLEELRKTLGW